MLKISRVVIISIFILSQLAVVAQNNTNSPYTRFGYGELADRSFGAGRAMGGIGYGLRSSKQINPLNPASYSCMDSLTFLFDFGASAQLSWFDDGLNKQTNVNGNIEYLALQFPIHKRVAMSVGLLPYSYVGYEFGSQSPQIGGAGLQQQSFVGTGGLNEIYGGLSVELWKKRLSVGANVGYLFGNITHENSIFILNADGSSKPNAAVTYNWQKIRVSDVKLDFGVQYTQPLTKTESLTLGLVYSPKNTLSNKMYQVMQQTENNSLVVQEGDTTRNTPMGLPDSYGIGLTYVKANKLTVGADVLYEQWKKVKFPFADNGNSFENRFRVAAGAEYIPNYMGKNFLGRTKYRVGAHFSNSYMKIQNSKYDEYGASIGLGLPLIDNRSLLNISFEYVKVAPKVNTMIDEQYFRMTVNYTFNEMWFRRFRLD